MDPSSSMVEIRALRDKLQESEKLMTEASRSAAECVASVYVYTVIHSSYNHMPNYKTVGFCSYKYMEKWFNTYPAGL